MNDFCSTSASISVQQWKYVCVFKLIHCFASFTNKFLNKFVPRQILIERSGNTATSYDSEFAANCCPNKQTAACVKRSFSFYNYCK